MNKPAQLIATAALAIVTATSALAADANSSMKVNKDIQKIPDVIGKKQVTFTCQPELKLKTQAVPAPANMYATGYNGTVDWLRMTFKNWKFDYNSINKSTDIYGMYCIASAPENGMTCQAMFMASQKDVWDCKPSGTTLTCTLNALKSVK